MRIDKLLYRLLIGTLAALLLMKVLAGCEVLKTRQSKSIDSTAVHKVDSGTVNIRTTDTKDSSNWWRETVEFLLHKPSGDTLVVVNPNITTPVRIIREGGNQVITDKSESYDMAWRNSVDSLNLRLDELSSSKEKSPAKFIQIAIVMGFVFVGLVMLMALIFLGLKVYRAIRL